MKFCHHFTLSQTLAQYINYQCITHKQQKDDYFIFKFGLQFAILLINKKKLLIINTYKI